jgi:hypothetical protein
LEPLLTSSHLSSYQQEYSKQRRAHEEEHVKAMATIEAAKELLVKKR